MKLEICSFSGHKIYPGRGKIYVRTDSRTFRFVSGKAESLFLQRKNPRKIHWTVVFRKMHKKGITEEGTMLAKKRTRKTVKYQRAVVGASFEAIKAKRQQKPEERQQARDAAVKKAKEAKKADAEKKAAAKAQAAAQQKAVKNIKGGAPKPSKVQAGGKR